jgi:hypothetical protein
VSGGDDDDDDNDDDDDDDDDCGRRVMIRVMAAAWRATLVDA